MGSFLLDPLEEGLNVRVGLTEESSCIFGEAFACLRLNSSFGSFIETGLW